MKELLLKSALVCISLLAPIHSRIIEKIGGVY